MLVGHVLEKGVWIILDFLFLLVDRLQSLEASEHGATADAARRALRRRTLEHWCAKATCLHRAANAFSCLMLYHFTCVLDANTLREEVARRFGVL